MKIKVRIGSIAFVVDQIDTDDTNNLVCLEYPELQYGVCCHTLEESIQMMGDFLKKEYNLEGVIE